MCSTWLYYETEFRSYCLQTIPLTGLAFSGLSGLVSLKWASTSSERIFLLAVPACMKSANAFSVYFSFDFYSLYQLCLVEETDPKWNDLKKIEQLISLSTSAEVDSSELVLWLCPQTPQGFRFCCFHIRLWRLNFNQDGYSRRIQHICNSNQ